MDRRAFLGAVAGNLVAAPFAAAAQASKPVRVGVLRPGPNDQVFKENFALFPRVLAERGFVEGRNLTMDYRVRPGTAEVLAVLAGELVELKVDVIVAISSAAVRAASRATRTLPIVAVDLESDPVAEGYVAALARPGGNVTGLFLDFPELGGKWVQLLKEAVPRLGRLAVLWDPSTGPNLLKGAEAAARLMKTQTQAIQARSPDDLATAFRAAADGSAEAVLVLSSPMLNSARARIAELAARHRMPSIMPFPGFAEDGGLLAYGPHLVAMFQQAAGIVVRVLLGDRPARVPIERPTRFELIVNLRVARAIGLTIPRSLLVRADRIIEG